MIPQFIVVFLAITFELMSFSIVIRVILSWVPGGGTTVGKIRSLFYSVTEPILGPFRRVLPPLGGVLDISPLIALLALQLLRDLLIKFLTEL